MQIAHESGIRDFGFAFADKISPEFDCSPMLLANAGRVIGKRNNVT